jgi:hypothetical protein
MKLLPTTILIENGNIAKVLRNSGIPVRTNAKGVFVFPQEVTFDPKNLTPGSSLNVRVLCGKCEKETYVPYRRYIRDPEQSCPTCQMKEYQEKAASISPASALSNLVHDEVEVTLLSPKDCSKWKDLGYEIPAERYDRGRNRAGKTLGYRNRYILGSKIKVKVKDLAPTSHVRILYRCASCGAENTTEYIQYLKRTTDLCPTCNKSYMGKANGLVKYDRKQRKLFGRTYWNRILIKEAENPMCDISGEKDKRFLVVHHIVPRNLGGEDVEENLVIITANLHQAFHAEYGHNVGRKEYEEFKAREQGKST